MLQSLRFWSRTMVHFAGDRTRRRRPTMPRFLKRWRAWLTSPFESMSRLNQWGAACMISTTCESMDRMHTTGRQRKVNDASIGSACDGSPRSPIGRRSGDRRFLFRPGAGHRFLPETFRQNRRRFFPGRPGNDGLGRRTGIRVSEPGLARIAGLGGECLSMRHYGLALVLDRRDPGDGVSRHRDDALLLHLQNPLRPRISAIALRSGSERAERGHIRGHDHPDVGLEHVLHGCGYVIGTVLDISRKPDHVVIDGGTLRGGGRTFFRDL